MKVEHWILLVGLLVGASPPAGAEPGEVKFSLGSQRVLTLPPEARGFSIGDERILESRLVGRQQLLLVGLRRGRTELLFFGPHGPIRRIQFNVDRFEACVLVICEACRLLPKGTQLEVTSMGDRPVVRGIARSIEEARAAKHLAWVYPEFLVDVRLSERALREGLLRVNHDLWRAGFLDARAIVVENQVGLRGHFASELEEELARAAIATSARWLEGALELPIVASETVEE